MGWRFRKSVKIVPGVRLNIGKRGASLSVGVKGATVNFSSKGTRYSLGIPGTGISYSELVKKKNTHKDKISIRPKNSSTVFGNVVLFVITLIGVIAQQPMIYIPFGCWWLLRLFICSSSRKAIIDGPLVDLETSIQNKNIPITPTSKHALNVKTHHFDLKSQPYNAANTTEEFTLPIVTIEDTCDIDVGSEKFGDAVISLKYDKHKNVIFLCVLSYKKYRKSPCGSFLSKLEIEEITHNLESMYDSINFIKKNFKNSNIEIEFTLDPAQGNDFFIKITDPNDKRIAGFNIVASKIDAEKLSKLLTFSMSFLDGNKKL